MTKLVRPASSWSSAAWIWRSVRVSTLLVASSRISRLRVGEGGAGDGEQLALALAQAGAAFAQHRLVAVR